MKYKTILRLLNGENRWNFVAERKKNLACWVVVISTIFIKNNLRAYLSMNLNYYDIDVDYYDLFFLIWNHFENLNNICYFYSH